MAVIQFVFNVLLVTVGLHVYTHVQRETLLDLEGLLPMFCMAKKLF